MNLRLIRAPVLGCFHDEIMRLRKNGGGYRRIAEVLNRYSDHQIMPASVGKYLKRVREVGEKFGYGDFPTSRQLGLDDRQKKFARSKISPEKVFVKTPRELQTMTGRSLKAPKVVSRAQSRTLSHGLSEKASESHGSERDNVPKIAGDPTQRGRHDIAMEAGLVPAPSSSRIMDDETRRWWEKAIDELSVMDILEMDYWYAQLSQEREMGGRQLTLEEIRRCDMVLELTIRGIRSKEEKKGRTADRPVEYDYVFKTPRLKAEFEVYERLPQEVRWAREAAGLSLPLEIYFPQKSYYSP